MKTKSLIQLSLFAVFILFLGFSLDTPAPAKSEMMLMQQKKDSNLNDKGIGPIKEVKLGPINQRLVDKGNDIFNDKCSACHDINDVNLAPALKGVTKILSPVFIMNYLMNTKVMQQKNTYVKNLMAQWKKVPIMKDQKLKESDARAVLEFLRSVDK